MLFLLKSKRAAEITACVDMHMQHYDISGILRCVNGLEFCGAIAMLCQRLSTSVINGKPRKL